MINGEAFELWGLKTMLGAYFGGVAAENGRPIRETHPVDADAAIAALDGTRLEVPRGLYVPAVKDNPAEHHVAIVALFAPEADRAVGMKMQMHGLQFDIIADSDGFESNLRRNLATHRPIFIDLNGPRRTSRVVVAWREIGFHMPSVQIELNLNLPSVAR